MTKKEPASSCLFINRELSWLESNDRVLQEGRSDPLPLAERLKFLSSVSVGPAEKTCRRRASRRATASTDAP